MPELTLESGDVNTSRYVCAEHMHHHATRDGLKFCRWCSLFHHLDYECLTASYMERRGCRGYSADYDPDLTSLCDECQIYHDGEDCPEAEIECTECELEHRPGDQCPREWCSDCDDFHDRNRWGYVECPGWYCDDCGDHHAYGDNCPSPYCDDCGNYHDRYESCSNPGGLLLGYTDNPELIFRGDGPAFYGLEVEVTAYGSALEQSVMEGWDARPDGQPVVFFKEDGSVEGFEMVSHPMSYDWAMANFPWHLLRAFDRFGCRIDDMENGIHVHVSRDAFATDSHLLRWMKLIYRNQGLSESVARRGGTHWCEFSRYHRRGHAAHVKAQRAKKRYNATRPAYGRGDEEALNAYARASEQDTTRDRYSAINTTNSQTLEVRIFASTLDPVEAQAALQYVAATVEYTRDLTSAQIIKGEAWSAAKFIAWLDDQDGKYASLQTVIAREYSN